MSEYGWRKLRDILEKRGCQIGKETLIKIYKEFYDNPVNSALRNEMYDLERNKGYMNLVSFMITNNVLPKDMRRTITLRDLDIL